MIWIRVVWTHKKTLHQLKIIYSLTRKTQSREEGGKLRRQSFHEWLNLESTSCLLPDGQVCYSAHQADPQEGCFFLVFSFFEGHVQKWICTLAPSQFQHSNSLETGMRAGSCVNTQLCRHWNTSWCMGWFACSFCFYSALIPHAFVQRRSHSCAGKLSVVSVHCHSALVFHEQ